LRLSKEKKRMSGFEVKERFYEIGSVEGLEELRKKLEAIGSKDEQGLSPRTN